MAITKLHAGEIKDYIRYIVKNNEKLQESGLVPVAVSIMGEAGLGKTSVVKQLGKELGKEVVKINLAQVEELGDIIGFPIKEHQVCKTENESDCQWINEHAIETYSKNGYKLTGRNRMSYAAPEWIANKTEGVLLLLDDWTRADTRFLNAVMDLINEQAYISWTMPKGSTIILTENPDNGSYMVNSIDDAIRTRFTNIEMVFDVKQWAKFAEEQGIDGRCINFLLLNPEIVNHKVNPRSLVTFFNSIRGVTDFSTKEGLSIIQMIGEGSIGEAATATFITFINNKLDKLVTPEFIMTSASKDLKKEMDAIVGRTNLKNYRADIASVLCIRTVNYMINHSKTKPVDKDLLDRIEELAIDEYFGPDLSYHMVKTLFAANPKFKVLATRNKLTKHVIG